MSSIAEIQRATAAHFGLTREELLRRGRSQGCVWPRQVGMAIAYEDGHSLPQIGRKFGRHHTTVLRATRAVLHRRDEIARDIAAIRADLARYTGVLSGGVEKKLEAARAIGAFCAAFGVSVQRLRSLRQLNTETRGSRGCRDTEISPEHQRLAGALRAPSRSSTPATPPAIAPKSP